MATDEPRVVDAPERVERRRDARGLADPAPDGQALGHERLRRLEVPAAVGVGAEPVEDRGHRLLVAHVAGDRERLAQVRLAQPVVALVRGEQARAAQRLAQDRGRRIDRHGQRRGE